MAKVVVIDNDEVTQVELQAWLGDEHAVLRYEKAALAVDFVHSERPDVVFLSLQLPDGDPLEILSLISRGALAPPVIGLVGEHSARTIVQAVRFGACDVIAKPLHISDIQTAFRRVFSSQTSAVEDASSGRIPEIVGSSRATAQTRNAIVQFAYSFAPVLILGESGVGKELVARALHRLSRLSNGRFVATNCAAVPDTLFETEMFGTLSGAYTDARTRKGAFEYATNGTLFLDEVGELTPGAQVKLLRVLDSGNFFRLGESEERHSNARVLAATNVHLKDSDFFRDDLYYRLSVGRIVVPPLRDRREDIPSLAHYFCDLLSTSEGWPETAYLTHGAVERLVHHDWPGNIRELKNVIWRAMLLTSSDRIPTDAIEFDQ